MRKRYQSAARPIKRVGLHYTGFRPQNRAGSPANAVARAVDCEKCEGWVSAQKGFGFIVNAGGQDVFVHFSTIEADGFRSLKDGEIVEYESEEGEKGLHAKHVRRLNPPARKATPRKERILT